VALYLISYFAVQDVGKSNTYMRRIRRNIKSEPR
jgi:hypothetical protein